MRRCISYGFVVLLPPVRAFFLEQNGGASVFGRLLPCFLFCIFRLSFAPTAPVLAVV
jgi:hypothetical protein